MSAVDVPVAEATTSDVPLFDSRLVNKPARMPVEKSKFVEWQFEFENFMSLVNPAFTDDMTVASNMRDPIHDSGNVELRKRSCQLYAILASLSQGRGKLMVRKLRESRNGFEA